MRAMAELRRKIINTDYRTVFDDFDEGNENVIERYNPINTLHLMSLQHTEANEQTRQDYLKFALQDQTEPNQQFRDTKSAIKRRMESNYASLKDIGSSHSNVTYNKKSRVEPQESEDQMENVRTKEPEVQIQNEQNRLQVAIENIIDVTNDSDEHYIGQDTTNMRSAYETQRGNEFQNHQTEEDKENNNTIDEPSVINGFKDINDSLKLVLKNINNASKADTTNFPIVIKRLKEIGMSMNKILNSNSVNKESKNFQSDVNNDDTISSNHNEYSSSLLCESMSVQVDVHNVPVDLHNINNQDTKVAKKQRNNKSYSPKTQNPSNKISYQPKPKINSSSPIVPLQIAGENLSSIINQLKINNTSISVNTGTVHSSNIENNQHENDFKTRKQKSKSHITLNSLEYQPTVSMIPNISIEPIRTNNLESIVQQKDKLNALCAKLGKRYRMIIPEENDSVVDI